MRPPQRCPSNHANVAAAGANQSWFHLYEVVQPPAAAEAGDDAAADAEEALSAAGTTLEQFMQTATLGEFAARLALLAAFRRHAAVQVKHETLQRWVNCILLCDPRQNSAGPPAFIALLQHFMCHT